MQDARSLASVIGEEELSDVDKKYMKFGERFEQEFVQPGPLGKPVFGTDAVPSVGRCLSDLPRSELNRIDAKMLDQHYIDKSAAAGSED